MAITFAFELCCMVKDRCDEKQVKKAGPYFDLITGVALLILGVIAANGIIGWSAAASYALVGAGSAYAFLMLCQILQQLKYQASHPEQVSETPAVDADSPTERTVE